MAHSEVQQSRWQWARRSSLIMRIIVITGIIGAFVALTTPFIRGALIR
jgi:hypothetical protein